ncbi:ABC transporter permease [Streptomyces sp. 549]|uniref:ABC transporter permease n=1 Tax=Streptomyces sp. 549 TaxID=3049076 RepID=UPI0024C40C04|nr:ABC transporter permease [Streptomyces sp. 549]MDK1474802.1 ABC transporter permease [Streptomyces sp. 549]
MLRTVLRTLRAHTLRFLMPALAVVLGVAFVAGSLLYGEAVSSSMASAQARSHPDVSVRIQPADDAPTAVPEVPGETAGDASAEAPDGDAGHARLDDALLRQLRDLPGVARVRPEVEGRTFVVGADGRPVGSLHDAVGVAHVPDATGADPRYPLVEGHGPRGPREVAVDRGTADRAGHRVGDRVRVVVGGEVLRVRLVGVFTAEDSRVAAGGSVTAFDLATARARLAPAPDQFDAVSLTAGPGVGADRLAAQADALLAPGLTALTRAQWEAEAFLPTDTKTGDLLLSFAAVALFVSTFLVANTFTMLSAARAREHALLRAVGATRGRVQRMVLAEAAVVGTLASAVGYLLGIGVGSALHALFPFAGGTAERLPLLAAKPLLASFAVGVGVTVVSAWLPARRAASVPPVAALRQGVPAPAGALLRRNLLGLGLVGLAAAAGSVAGDDQMLFLTAAGLLLVGMIVLTPWFALGATGLLRRPMARLAQVHGRLAVANARRNPRRTAATATALMIGLALVTAATVAITSIGAHGERKVAASFPADLRVTAVDFGEIDDSAARRVARLPGTRAVSPTASEYGGLPGGGHLDLLGLDPGAAADVLPVTVREGSLADLYRGVAVTTETARERGWQLGSTAEITFGSAAGDGTEPVRLPVVALYEKAPFADSALVDIRTLRADRPGLERPQLTSVLVRAAAPERTAALKDEVVRALDNPTLLVQDRRDAVADESRATRSLLAIVYALLSVTVVIGALGVVNTMTMAVFERVREIGLLRAVGLDRSGVRAVLRLESVTISLLGCAIGLVTGTVIGAAAVRAQLGGPAVVVPWPELGAFTVLTAVIGVLASLWPAHRAAAVPLLDALRSDTE